MEETIKSTEYSVDGEMPVYIPDWMSELESQQVETIMAEIAAALGKPHDEPMMGSSLAIALVNVAAGILARGLLTFNDDVEVATGISMVASSMAAFTEAFAQFVEQHVPEETRRLLGEPEGNA